jgi:hypothetical protein
MPDLAIAMKYNQDLKSAVERGLFRSRHTLLRIYEMQHLPIPAKLQKNIKFQFYESGLKVEDKFMQDSSY